MKYLVVILLGMILIAGCVQQSTETTKQATLIVAAKDHEERPSVGNVSELILTISKVEVHFKSSEIKEKIEVQIDEDEGEAEVEIELGKNETEFELNTTNTEEIIDEIVARTGLDRETVENLAVFEEKEKDVEEDENGKDSGKWVTVSNETKTFDLLKFTNASALLAEAGVPVGQYTQVRLFIESAQATIDGKVVNLTVPSGVLRFVNNFEVEENMTEVLILDFQVEKSIVKERNEFILKPVIKIEELKFEEDEIDEEKEKEDEGIEDIEEDELEAEIEVKEED